MTSLKIFEYSNPPPTGQRGGRAPYCLVTGPTLPETGVLVSFNGDDCRLSDEPVKGIVRRKLRWVVISGISR
jgi:hypothetical protein